MKQTLNLLYLFFAIFFYTFPGSVTASIWMPTDGNVNAYTLGLLQIGDEFDHSPQKNWRDSDDDHHRKQPFGEASDHHERSGWGGSDERSYTPHDLSTFRTAYQHQSVGQFFGIFEDTAIVGDDDVAPVLTFVGGATIGFVNSNGINWTLTARDKKGRLIDRGELLGSNHFQFAWFSNRGWVTERSSEENPFATDVFSLIFGKKRFSQSLIVNDVSLTSVLPDEGPIATVPLPAAVWTMTSALLGLLFAARRKGAFGS